MNQLVYRFYAYCKRLFRETRSNILKKQTHQLESPKYGFKFHLKNWFKNELDAFVDNQEFNYVLHLINFNFCTFIIVIYGLAIFVQSLMSESVLWEWPSSLFGLILGIIFLFFLLYSLFTLMICDLSRWWLNEINPYKDMAKFCGPLQISPVFENDPDLSWHVGILCEVHFVYGLSIDFYIVDLKRSAHPYAHYYIKRVAEEMVRLRKLDPTEKWTDEEQEMVQQRAGPSMQMLLYPGVSSYNYLEHIQPFFPKGTKNQHAKISHKDTILSIYSKIKSGDQVGQGIGLRNARWEKDNNTALPNGVLLRKVFFFMHYYINEITQFNGPLKSPKEIQKISLTENPTKFLKKLGYSPKIEKDTKKEQGLGSQLKTDLDRILKLLTTTEFQVCDELDFITTTVDIYGDKVHFFNDTELSDNKTPYYAEKPYIPIIESYQPWGDGNEAHLIMSDIVFKSMVHAPLPIDFDQAIKIKNSIVVQDIYTKLSGWLPNIKPDESFCILETNITKYFGRSYAYKKHQDYLENFQENIKKALEVYPEAKNSVVFNPYDIKFGFIPEKLILGVQSDAQLKDHIETSIFVSQNEKQSLLIQTFNTERSLQENETKTGKLIKELIDLVDDLQLRIDPYFGRKYSIHHLGKNESLPKFEKHQLHVKKLNEEDYIICAYGAYFDLCEFIETEESRIKLIRKHLDQRETIGDHGVAIKILGMLDYSYEDRIKKQLNELDWPTGNDHNKIFNNYSLYALSEQDSFPEIGNESLYIKEKEDGSLIIRVNERWLKPFKKHTKNIYLYQYGFMGHSLSQNRDRINDKVIASIILKHIKYSYTKNLVRQSLKELDDIASRYCPIENRQYSLKVLSRHTPFSKMEKKSIHIKETENNEIIIRINEVSLEQYKASVTDESSANKIRNFLDQRSTIGEKETIENILAIVNYCYKERLLKQLIRSYKLPQFLKLAYCPSPLEIKHAQG